MVDIHMVSWLIIEVAVYKGYLVKHEVLKINDQSLPMNFQFSMRENIPIYQYKQNINNASLPLKDGVLGKKIIFETV
jgi:hypothetical protein